MRILLICVFMIFTGTAHASCLKNGDSTSVAGVLVVKTYQSPDDIPRPVRKWVLQLDTPLKCVAEVDTSFPAWNSDITIIPLNGLEQSFSYYADRRVIVSGKIALAATAYHYTAILLLADKVEQVKK
ncbi:DUF4431 domain-containing protein [Intestinirhabdus alba]|jgi:hypothetical protein|uniref:DUF4431 domain-containing protein n=1 Tax=Intestinirhabdus alba TaxID=2899544 RepID=A0A6L6IPS2_9ENTR|nr:DUF4431 domain-containing protein [Intestinirhabdus alba]MTH48215.1 DUF4431 domain-containing protein [Intestinirhabdus alba]